MSPARCLARRVAYEIEINDVRVARTSRRRRRSTRARARRPSHARVIRTCEVSSGHSALLRSVSLAPTQVHSISTSSSASPSISNVAFAPRWITRSARRALATTVSSIATEPSHSLRSDSSNVMPVGSRAAAVVVGRRRSGAAGAEHGESRQIKPTLRSHLHVSLLECISSALNKQHPCQATAGSAMAQRRS